MRKKQTEIIVDDETEANITETINSKGETVKRVNYTAKVKENDVIETDENTENPDENFDNENDDSFIDNESDEIPKDKLDKMFDDIERVSSGINSVFFAKVTRQPDSLSDNFFNRCGGEMPLGVFQFSLRDRFNFIPQIQKINGNSGGYFNILIFDGQQKPLGWSYRIGYSRETGFKHIGCHNVLVPNPALIETPNANGQPQQNGSLEMVFGKMAEMMQQNHNQLMQVINRQPEKSTLEKAIEQKMLNDLLNPPQQQASGFEQTMASIMAMPVMVEKMSAKMFPAPPVEREPTTLDTIQSIVAMPVVENTATAVLNGLSLLIESKMQEKQQGVIQNLPNEVVINPQPNQITTATETDDMKELLQDVIEELESDSVLDDKNEFLIELKSDYPTQTMMITSLCKTNTFENVLQLLITQADSAKPVNPFAEFLDVAETQKQQKYVWTERGNKLIKRLNEFYEFAKK